VSRALVYFVSLLTLVMGAAAFAQEPLAAPRAGPAPQAVQGSSIRFQADGCAEIAPAAIRRINEFLADFPRTRASLQKLLERPGLPPAGKVMLLEGWSTTYRELTNAVAAQGQSSRVAELLRQGDMDQAAVALDEALRNESLQALAEAARNHSHRAQVYELQFERARALFHYEMAYSYQASYQNGLDYATALHAAGQIGRAVSVYEDALGKLRSAAGNRSPEEQLALAVTLTNLASLYRDTQRTEDAVRIYEEALGVRRGLARSDPAAHRPILAMTLTNLAHLYHERQQPEQAGRTIQEALTISRQLWQENPQANGDLLAQALITAVRIAPTPNPSVECPLVEEALRVATSDAIKQVAQLYLQACSGTRN
jgi:tetratricopeptide (TPR) repeat protein